MFGSALGSADNGFIVADGRFANVSSIYDPDSLLTSTEGCSPGLLGAYITLRMASRTEFLANEKSMLKQVK